MSRGGEGGAPCNLRANIVNKTEADTYTSTAEGPTQRAPWRRPTLRKMEALDAQMPAQGGGKKFTSHDTFHLS
jgi:hypothetical protein